MNPDLQKTFIKSYYVILDYAEDHWRDPVWDFFYSEISFEDFIQSSKNFNLDSEDSMIKYFREWAERRYKFKSFL